MVNDTVSDMITRLRNANIVKIQTVNIPSTKMTRSLAQILQSEGFIESVDQTDPNQLALRLKYKGKKRIPYITTLKRISKPGMRVYINHTDIPKILGGIGIAVLSTSQGIMSDRTARQKGLGGEVLCYIW
jgi:small subunit ribosomal protein S8